MDELKRLRIQIDEIDEEIIRLLKSRYEYAEFLGRIKKTRGQPIRNLVRERQILRSVQRLAFTARLPRGPVRKIFLQIFKTAVEAQTARGNRDELGGLQVLVAGGTGGMGMFFANFAATHGATVRIFGRTPSKSRKVAAQMGLETGGFSDAPKSDIVLIAVPIGSTRNVSLKLASLMTPGTLLSDLSSVKSGVSDKIDAGILGVEYVSLHPLFAPDISHMAGQHIMAIPYREGPRWRQLHSVFRNEGARVHVTTVLEHDRAMAQIQSLPHFALICLGQTLNGWDGKYSTRSLRITVEQLSRVLENWSTVSGIQRFNPFSAQARENFKSTVEEMDLQNSSDARAARRVLGRNVQKWSRKQ